MNEEKRTAPIEVKPIDTKIPEQAMVEANAVLDNAKEIVVTDQGQYEYCADALKDIKSKSRDLEDERKKITVPIDAAKKAIQDLFRRPKEALIEAESILKKAMIIYTDKQEKKRREEQAKLEAKAAVDRKKKEDQAEEWRKKEEDLRAEGKDDQADKAADKADEREVEAEQVIAPVAAPKVDKVAGLSYKDNWFAEVADFALLPDTYKLPDMVKLNKQAKATKDSVPVPGIVFKKERILVSR